MLRRHLMEGMTFEKHGHNRRTFHEMARELAEQVCYRDIRFIVQETNNLSSSPLGLASPFVPLKRTEIRVRDW